MEKREEFLSMDGENRNEQRLSEVQESLCRRIARLDRSDAPVEKNMEAPVTPDGLKDVPQRMAPCPDPPDREALMAKLVAIRDAYERLLTYWPFVHESPSESSDDGSNRKSGMD
jgi:hypothetical protein